MIKNKSYIRWNYVIILKYKFCQTKIIYVLKSYEK